MATSTDPILSLRTIVEYPTVEIDGHRYRLTPADALPLFSRLDLEVKESRVAMLITAPSRTKVEETEMLRMLDELCRQVLEAPGALHDQLTDVHRMLIYEAFVQLPRANRQPTEAKATAAVTKHDKSSGAKSSRGSRASMVAVPSSGSPESRSDSSEPAA